jgi:hypothetical protein
MAHRIQVEHDFPGVLGQTAHAHLQQARLDLPRIVREFVAAAPLVIG